MSKLLTPLILLVSCLTRPTYLASEQMTAVIPELKEFFLVYGIFADYLNDLELSLVNSSLATVNLSDPRADTQVSMPVLLELLASRPDALSVRLHQLLGNMMRCYYPASVS